MASKEAQPGLEVRLPEGYQPGLETHQPVYSADAKHASATMPKEYNSSNNDSYYGPRPPQSDAISPTDTEATTRNDRRILGLRPVTFWLSLALALVVILAAALGGELGAGMKSKNNNKPTSISSTPAPATPSSTVAPTAVYGLSSCPHNNNKMLTSGSTSSSFTTGWKVYCSSYFYIGGSDATNISNGRTASLEDCIGLCDSMRSQGNTNVTVNAIVYNRGDKGKQPVGNCWCTNYPDTRVSLDDAYDVAVVAADAT